MAAAREAEAMVEVMAVVATAEAMEVVAKVVVRVAAAMEAGMAAAAKAVERVVAAKAVGMAVEETVLTLLPTRSLDLRRQSLFALSG